MQVVKRVEVRASRIHETAKEMLPTIPRKIILLTYGAFSLEEMVLKPLVRMKLRAMFIFPKCQKENEQTRLSF